VINHRTQFNAVRPEALEGRDIWTDKLLYFAGGDRIRMETLWATKDAGEWPGELVRRMYADAGKSKATLLEIFAPCF